MTRPRALLLAAAFAAAPAATLADAGPLIAERITAERYDALAVGGPDADAGVGDYALSNGSVCAAIAAPEHETFLSPVGGTLIDLGLCGRADDQWSSLHGLPSFDRARPLPISRVRVEVAGGEARAISEGEGGGLRVRITHALGGAAPRTLRVTTELTRLRGGPRLMGFAELAMHASSQMRSFHLVRRDPARSQGFVHPGGVSLWTGLDMLAPADISVLVGADGLPEVSYALLLRRAMVRGPRGVRRIPAFAVTAEDFTLTGVVPHGFWLGGGGRLGLLEALQVPLMSLAEGETLVLERAIRVGARSDVASALDGLLKSAATVTGRVDDPRARIHFDTRDGHPFSEVRSRVDGSFSLRLPPGAYRLHAWAPGGRHVARDFAVSTSGAQLTPLAVGAPASLTLPRGHTMRLVFIGLGETPTPHLDDDGLGFRVGEGKLRKGDADNVVSLAASEADPRAVVLAPGRYRVLATRGLEFGVVQAELTLAPGETRALEIAEPARALDSAGWIAADLHVHSAESMDAALPLPMQLLAFTAQGGEVIANTEHDRIIDAGPLIARLGLAGRIVNIIGAEVTGTFHGGQTPFTIGHLNALPLRYERTAGRGGAPHSEGVRVRDVIREVRATSGAPFVQINHPRESEPDKVGDGAFFSHLGVSGKPFEPAEPLDDARNRSLLEPGPGGVRDLDFSAIEVLNGKRLDRYRLTRADWLSLTLQGERRTATANSDSHSRGELVAVPRNYVALADDAVPHFDEAAFVASLRAGRSFGTTGPLVFARLGSAGLGDTFAGDAGDLVVEVRAAPWVPVRELRVYVDAVRVAQRPIHAGERATFPLRFAHDGFVFVEVTGEASGLYAEVLPRAQPFAFTNPIWVDADRDGHWRAPGLPHPAPPLLAHPLRDE